ncbi:hypothetical protein CTAYLR_009463 [Chrysophaeum taylorii]|uniref:AAA+ ATPase domain-containing protein n=1 Tax=Chrysophaeum taylorii TaxID=2483200 RepID=A0AAD7U7Z3_9STRA|nr:hypothetical protein CTAYLR_009463 [Chrysophaeum taylorii]
MEETMPTKRLKRSKEETTNAQPWVEKYRPSTLNELVAHKEIIGVIKRLIAEDRLPHMLLYGPPGTGKTSTITAAAKDMYGKNYGAMTLELNASDDRGIDVVRNQIKEFAATRRLWASSGTKLVILDEADMMTNDAQFALRRVIEKYTANTRFCLVCNYANKIIPALQSRCTKFRFAPLAPDQIRARLGEIVRAENITMDERAIDALLGDLGRGDMRRVLNILQATSVAYPDRISYDSLFLVTGNPLPSDVDAIYVSLLNDSFATARATVADLAKTRGYALPDLLTRLADKVLTTQFPPHFKAHLLEKLADLEYRASFATSDNLQLSALVAAFVGARGLQSD